MRDRLAFCLRLGVLCSALFACSADDRAVRRIRDRAAAAPAGALVRPRDLAGRAVPAAGVGRDLAADRTVLLDVSPPPLASLTVEGALAFDEADLDLTAGWILVKGTLRVGTAAQPFQHRATITLTGSPDGPNRRWRWATGCSACSTAARSTCTASRATAGPGSPRPHRPAPSQLLLEAAPDWRAGDKLVVASTDFDPAHAEVVTVAGRSGSAVTLGPAARVRPLGRAPDHRTAGPWTSAPRWGSSPATS